MSTPRASQQTASQRLIASRAQLRAQLAGRQSPLPADQRLGMDLLQVAAGVEGADPSAIALRWARAQVDQRLGDPVREYPLTAVGLGLGAGALIALARPWRWRLPTPLLLGLTTQLLLPWLARQRR